MRQTSNQNDDSAHDPTAPERFRDSINVPIAIPAWGALVMIAGALFTSGTLYQKMDALIENSRQSDARITVIHERQFVANAAILSLEKQGQSLNDRVSNLERGMFQEKRIR